MSQTPSFARTRPLVPWFGHVVSIDSTNRHLLANASDLPNWAVMVADLQTGGRGRSGRTWDAPAASSLLASVLVRPVGVPATQFGWLPLIAGLSMVEGISALAPSVRAGVKWPNDVLIRDHKVCGILSELLPDASGVVIGSGVNLFQTREQLPIETATSLSLEGVELGEADELLYQYLRSLKKNVAEFEALNGELDGSDLLQRIRANCVSIGRDVRVVLPSGHDFHGVANDIDALGRLVVRGSSETLAVSAGDVVHLRHN